MDDATYALILSLYKGKNNLIYEWWFLSPYFSVAFLERKCFEIFKAFALEWDFFYLCLILFYGRPLASHFGYGIYTI